MRESEAPESSGAERAVAYLVSQYPAYSHAFVANEIAAVEAVGWRVHPFSVRNPDPIDHDGTEEVFVLQDKVLRRTPAVGAYLLRRPRLTVRALRLALSIRPRSGRLRPMALSLVYVYEAAVLARELDARRIANVHVHFSNNAADIALLSTALRGVTSQRPTWTMTIHGPTDFELAESQGLATKAANANSLFCISEYARGELEKSARAADAARAQICRMGVSDDALVPVRRGQAPANTFRILFVGRLVEKKNPRGLLRAAMRMARLHPEVDVNLRMLGDGPEMTALKQLADRRPENLEVELPGATPHDDVMRAYESADVFCLPSFSEGLPVVLMEALASQLAVIATPVAAIPELIKDGQTGLLVEPADEEKIADALGLLHSDIELRRHLGLSGRRLVESEFLASSAALVLDQAFTRMAESSPARRI